jgi:hypothetical protein
MSYDDIDPELEAMNTKFAVVERNGKIQIMRTDKPALEFISFYDFRNFYMHKKRRTAKGSIGLGTAWINYGNHRQFDGLEFVPGGPEVLPGNLFNTWRGWAVAPKKGDCSKFLNHVQDVICSGDADLYKYMMDWLADCIQHPNKPGEVAVVLRGTMGVGKGVFTSTLGELFRPGIHFTQIVHQDQLVGKHNKHLVETVLANVDEAYYAGDVKHRSVLKNIITEMWLQAEPKGIDAHLVPNHLHLIICSNEQHVVPAGADERRFFCVDVSDARKGDFKYFAAIKTHMNHDGLAALLYELQHRDLTGVNLREIPQTKALADQKALSRRGIDAFIELICREGQLPVSGPKANICYTGDRTVDVQEDVGGFTNHRTEFREGLWSYLKKQYRELWYSNPPHMLRQLEAWGCAPWSSGARRGVQFPPLKELRAAFVKKWGATEWPDDVVDWNRLKNPALTRAESQARAESWKALSANNEEISDDDDLPRQVRFSNGKFSDDPPVASNDGE